jgi:hypothetical protein
MTFLYPASDHHPRASAKPAAGFARPPSAPCVSPPSAERTSAAHQPQFRPLSQGDREAIGDASYLLARHRAETALLATDRVLALLCRVEAIADHRIDNDVAAVAKLPALRDLARAAIAAHTSVPFDNPLFPLHDTRDDRVKRRLE